MARPGVPVGTVRDIAGHASLATTGIYIDSDPDASAAALDRSPLGQSPDLPADDAIQSRHGHAAE
jgi:hypothetical protein